MKVMNVAVVGAGIYGINHVNAYTWNPNTNLVAVCDLPVYINIQLLLCIA